MLCLGANGVGPLGEYIAWPGVVETGYGNVLVRPVPGTLFPLPWASYESAKTGEVICETFWQDGRPQLSCSRHVASKQVQKLAELGYKLVGGFECEFFMWHKDSGEKLFKTHDDMTMLGFGENDVLLYSLESQLRQAGIDIESMLCEHGNGQFEFALSAESGLRSADNVVRLKEALKEIGSKKGYTVTFMSKPSVEAGTGLHFNHSLQAIMPEDSEEHNDSRYVFHDASAPNHMSEVFGWWLAGLVKHSRALTALCSPTVNCYRRLHTFNCPVTADWGVDRRRCTYRVRNFSPSETFLENRLSAGSANAYLVLAGTVAAGLDGIRNRLVCPPECDSAAPEIPHTLAEAVDALVSDEVMVESLGEEFIQWFKLMKYENDIAQLKSSNVKDENDLQGFQKERELYLRAM